MKTQFVIIFLIFSMGCAHKTMVSNSKFTFEKDITLVADFIKDKKEVFDLDLSIYNDGDKPFEKKIGDFSCGRGAYQGDFKKFHHLEGAAGNHAILIPPKEKARYLIVCKTTEEATGNYYLSIAKTPSSSKKPPEFEKWELIPIIK